MYFFLKSAYLYALTLWVGGIFFFTVVGAPTAFKVLPKEEAGKYTGSVFPKYFLLGYVFGLTALISFYFLEKGNITVFGWLNLLLLLVMNFLNFVNGFFIVPKAGLLKAEFYRSGNRDLYDKFKRLHAVSMVLNGAVLLLGLMSVGITAIFLTF